MVWYATWLAAVVFSAKTKVQFGRDAMSPARAIASIGVILMFVPIGAPVWSPPAAVRWSLVALTVAGFGFCWWARLHLGRLWSGFVTLKEGHHIVDTGPYGLVRHPIYAGLIFSALMTAFAEATTPAIVGAAMVAAGFWSVARTEERFLRDQLGAEGYDAYARRVPMLLPRLM